MKMKRWISFCVTVALFFLSTPRKAEAGFTGKVSGSITNAETGEQLPGANILIEGTSLGAVADLEGNYFILNVPPGTYSIRASMMGFQTLKKTEVRVSIDKTSSVSFRLNATVIPGREVVVVAERSVIQADIANTQTVLNGDQIAAIPVSQFKDVLDKQIGVWEADMRGLTFRGERQYAVSMRIDGIETRDNVDNQIQTRINPDAVQEANVLTGGFGAEYGNAGAGVVNVVLKEGGNAYTVSLDGMVSIPSRKHFGPPLKYYYDQKFDNMENWTTQANNKTRLTGIYSQFYGKPELLRELYRWRMRDEVVQYGNKSDMNLRATFGGPIRLVKNSTFFLSGNYEKNYYLFNQAVPFYKNLNFSEKAAFQITSSIKLVLTNQYTELSGINRYDREDTESSLSIDRRTNPDQTRENRYVFENVDGIAWTAAQEQAHLSPWPYTDKMSISNRYKNQWGLRLTQALGPKSFYEILASYSDFRISGVIPKLRDTTQTVTLRDSQGNTAILTGQYALAPVGYWFMPFSDPIGMGNANIMGGTHGDFERSRDKVFAIRADLTGQITKSHQVNAGIEFNYVDLNKDERREGSDGATYWWKWHVYPKTVGAWFQDKIEFEGMVANLSLRADVRIPQRSWMHFNTDSTRWDHRWSDFYLQGYLGQDSVSYGPTYRPPLQVVLSPRVSVAHPIGKVAKIFFNYTHQNQQPEYELQYRLAKRGDSKGSYVFGNPELPYIKNIQYEVGYEQNIADKFFAAVSGYYRDGSNRPMLIQYVGSTHQIGGKNYITQYNTYAPDQYGTARGLEMRLEKRTGQYWTGWLNYDYEIYSSGIRGYSRIYENPTQAPVKRNSNIFNNLNVRLTPMPRFNCGVDLHTPGQFGPRVWGLHLFADMRLDLLFSWRSQPTATYNPGSLQAPYAPLDNKRWKAHRSTNLTFRKRFDFKTFITPIFYVQIYNVFNDKNMFRGAFNTAQFNEYCRLLEQQGGQPGEKENLALQALVNEPQVQGPGTTPYDLYLNPRQIFFGIRLEIK